VDVKDALILLDEIYSKMPGKRIRNLRPFKDMIIILSNDDFLNGREFTIKHCVGNRKPRILKYTLEYLELCMKDIIRTIGEADVNS